jgi:hypothetical protein
MSVLFNPTKETVLQTVTSKSAGKEDRIIAMKSLHAALLPDGDSSTLKYYGGNPELEIEYSRWAETQLFNRAKVPTQFYDRCSKELKQSIFNEHVPRTDTKLLMRRAPNATNRLDDTRLVIRAVLTDSYGVIDDSQIFPVVLDTLAEQSVELFRKFEWDDHITRLFVDFEDANATYQNVKHIAGMVISNSETGHSSVWIEPSVNIPNCHFVNRSILKGQGFNCRIVHRGEVDNKQLKNMVLKAKEIAQVGVVQIAEAWDEMLPRARFLSFTKQMEVMPNRIKLALEEQWMHQEDMSKAAAARDIILAVKDMPLFQRLQIEQETGSFIGLFSNYQSRMDAVLEEIG